MPRSCGRAIERAACVSAICLTCLLLASTSARAQDSPQRASDLVADALGGASERARVASAVESALATRAHASSAAQIESSTDVVIRGIEIECSAPVCEENKEALREMTGLELGQSFSFELIERATTRLFKTGLFEEIELERERVDRDGVKITFALTGAIRIRKVSFAGVSPPPFEEDYERLLIYRQGQPFRGLGRGQDRRRVALVDGEFRVLSDSTQGANHAPVRDSVESPERVVQEDERILAQLKSFSGLLEREGYFNARIELSMRRAQDDPYAVELEFEIKKGPSLQVCQLGVRGARALSYSQARTLLYDDRPIWTRYLSFINPRYTESMLRAGQEVLIKEYRERGYYQARLVNKVIRSGALDKCVEVLVDLDEGPHWDVKFHGNQAFTSEELAAQVVFLQTGYVDERTIERTEQKLSQLYATRGYPFASVECEEEREDRLERTIDCFVEEGNVREIRSISFVTQGGTERRAAQIDALTDDALLASMRTRPFGLFDSGGYFQLEELVGDLGRIEDRYRANGYLMVIVRSFEVEPVGDDGLKLKIVIDEGAQTMVERVDVDKLREVQPSLRGQTSSSALLESLGVRGGEPFVPLSVRTDNSRLTQRYAAIGYPMANVETTCAVGAASLATCSEPALPEGCLVKDASALERAHCEYAPQGSGYKMSCERARDDEECVFADRVEWERVRVMHTIAPGPLINVGKIWLGGNLETRTDLILGELSLQRGDRLDVKRLLEGQANLRSLGLFDSVSVEAIGLDEGALEQEMASAALLVSVEEGDHRFANFSAGIQGRDLFNSTNRRLLVLGEANYTNRNLFGRGQRLQPRGLAAVDTLQLAALSTGIATRALTFAESASQLDYLVGLELVYNHPRFLKARAGVDRLALTVAPYYLLDLLGVTNNNLLREEFGARSELRKELRELLDRLFATVGLEGKLVATRSPESSAFDPQGNELFSPRRTVGKIYMDLTLDRRDSPLNPTEGYFLQFAPQWVSGDALGGRGDALQDSFFKLTFAASGYVSARKIIFGQSLRFGQVLPMFGRRLPVPEDERYVLGGVSSVRGFPEAGVRARVGSYRDLLRGGEIVISTSSELRYPLLSKYGIYGATFADVGVLADCFDDENSTTAVNCYEDAFPRDDRLSKVRLSSGIGVRYLIGEQIPLLLDYAMLLDRRPGESFSYLHFNVGYSF